MTAATDLVRPGFEAVAGRSRWLPTIDKHQEALSRALSGPNYNSDTPTLSGSLAECKRQISRISMHLPVGWFGQLNNQLDLVLDEAEWDPLDPPPRPESYATFLRMLLVVKPPRRPGLGLTAHGNFVAMWTVGEDKLTIECLRQDVVRWWLSRSEGQIRERAAGETVITRLHNVLAPYSPHKWYGDAH